MGLQVRNPVASLYAWLQQIITDQKQVDKYHCAIRSRGLLLGRQFAFVLKRA